MVEFLLGQDDGKITCVEVPAEEAIKYLFKALGLPDNYKPNPVSPERKKVLERLGAELDLNASSFLHAIDKETPFDRNTYIELASRAYDVQKDNLIRVLEKGEEIFGKENHLKIIDYIGLYFQGENHKVDGKTYEEFAKYLEE
jgi:hypothetical protein